jgi:hypothetical protein
VIGDLLILAVASALYPLLLAAVLVMLNAPRPGPLLVGYLIGGLIISISLGVAILIVLDQAHAVGSRAPRTLSPAVNLAAGVLAILIAMLLLRRPRHPRRPRRRRREKPKDPQREPLPQRVLAHGSARKAFGLGIILSLPSLYYLAALRDIAEEHPDWAVRVALILLFNLIQFTLIEVPLVGFLVAPERTALLVTRFNEWLRSHLRQVGAVVALAIGIYLVIKGIRDLE